MQVIIPSGPALYSSQQNAQAVEDGATVRIYYESRLAKVNLSEEGKQFFYDAGHCQRKPCL